MKINGNRSGQVFQKTFAGSLLAAGIFFDEQVPIGISIYEESLRVDFVLRNLAVYPYGLIVEAKWQDVAGSADEKFPYLVENIKRCYPMPTIVLADGGGARAGALAWLHAQVDGRQFIAVQSLTEFLSWVLRSEKLPLDRLFGAER